MEERLDPELLERAVAISPKFVAAWESLALIYATQARWQIAGEAFNAMCRRAEDAAANALAHAPASPVVEVSRCLMAPICGAFLLNEQRADRALVVAPNDPLVLATVSSNLGAVGRVRASIPWAARAQELDPLSEYVNAWYGNQLSSAGLTAQSDEVFDRAIQQAPNNGYLQFNAMGCAWETGNHDRYDRLAARKGNFGLFTNLIDAINIIIRERRAWTAASSRQSLDAQRTELAATGVISLRTLGFLYEQGAHDEVYDIIDEAQFGRLFQPGGRLHAHDIGVNLLFDPGWAAARRDPRFPRLCARLGFADYWIATGEWPDCAQDVASIYDFEAEARASHATGR